ncbi:hypothetical protein TNCV_4859701 [Trichonephila clavipes]|nr:hypothetical protein TNCV_4859701 [Trichonephila clavipes]
MYLEFAYTLRPLKGYGLKVSYMRNYPFYKKGLEEMWKKVRRWGRNFQEKRRQMWAPGASRVGERDSGFRFQKLNFSGY